jgi:hypothetical protein
VKQKRGTAAPTGSGQALPKRVVHGCKLRAGEFEKRPYYAPNPLRGGATKG